MFFRSVSKKKALLRIYAPPLEHETSQATGPSANRMHIGARRTTTHKPLGYPYPPPPSTYVSAWSQPGVSNDSALHGIQLGHMQRLVFARYLHSKLKRSWILGRPQRGQYNCLVFLSRLISCRLPHATARNGERPILGAYLWSSTAPVPPNHQLTSLQ